MSNGKLPTKCDRCGGPLKRGEFKRVRFDRSYAGVPISTRWVTDEFKRYYCLNPTLFSVPPNDFEIDLCNECYWQFEREYMKNLTEEGGDD